MSRDVTKMSRKCHEMSRMCHGSVSKMSRGVTRCHEVSRGCHECLDVSPTRHQMSTSVTHLSPFFSAKGEHITHIWLSKWSKIFRLRRAHLRNGNVTNVSPYVTVVSRVSPDVTNMSRICHEMSRMCHEMSPRVTACHRESPRVTGALLLTQSLQAGG